MRVELWCALGMKENSLVTFYSSMEFKIFNKVSKSHIATQNNNIGILTSLKLKILLHFNLKSHIAEADLVNI